MKCSFILRNGMKCAANSLRNGNYCFRHDPSMQSEALEASRIGGQHRLTYQKYGEDISFETASDIREFLGGVLNLIWSGRGPYQLAGPLTYLTKAWLDAYQISKLEDQVNSLKERLDKAKL